MRPSVIRLPAGYADIGRVLGGTVARNGLRGLLKLVVAGFVAPAGLGVLAAVYSFFKITESLVDLGLDYATVTFVPAALRRGDELERRRILQVVLGLKLSIIVGMVVAGNLVARRVTVWVFSDPDLTVWVRLAFLALGGQLLWKYISSYLTAEQRFTRLAFFLTTTPLLMLATTLGLMAAGRFSLQTAILIYLFGPAATVALWWIALEREVPHRPLWDRELARRILRFSRWPYLSSLASANRNNINPLLLKNAALSGSLARGEVNAGLYSFGNDLASELTVVSESLVTVLLPKASTRTAPGELQRFVRRSYRHLVLLMIPLALFLLAARPALLVLGWFHAGYLDYLPSLRVFYLLYSGALLSIVAIPIKTAMYALRVPQIETYIELAMVPVLIAGSVLLIPRYGAEGAAMMVLLQRAVTFTTLMAYGRVRLAHPPAEG